MVMADTGIIQKNYDMYIDREGTDAAVTKGLLVCPTCSGGTTTASTVGLVSTVAGESIPPYGVALETCTAAAAVASGILVAWRGVVEATHDIVADDAIFKNEPLMPSATTTGKFTGWTSATAEYLVIGHALEALTSIAAEGKILLAGW